MLIDRVLPVPDYELSAPLISHLKISSYQMLDGKILYEETPLIDLLEVFLLAGHDIRASLCMDDITREFTGRTFTEDVAKKFQISRKRAKQFITRLQNKNYIFFRERGYVVRSDGNELDRQIS